MEDQIGELARIALGEHVEDVATSGEGVQPADDLEPERQGLDLGFSGGGEGDSAQSVGAGRGRVSCHREFPVYGATEYLAAIEIPAVIATSNVATPSKMLTLKYVVSWAIPAAT